MRQGAWTQLFQAYAPIFLAYLRRHYHRYPDADHDALVVAAFIKALENLPHLISAESRHAYFWRIFMNAVSDFLRERTKGGLSSTLEVAQERVTECLKQHPLGFDGEAAEFIARQFRCYQDDLDRASLRVYRVGKRQGARITLALARDALVDFETGSAELGSEAHTDFNADETSDLATLVDLNNLHDEFEDCFRRTMTEYRERYPKRQQYLDLRIVAAMTNTEIERTLGRTPGATREFLSKCRQKFEQLLMALCGSHAAAAAEDLL